jgi:hypothetical protein
LTGIMRPKMAAVITFLPFFTLGHGVSLCAREVL